VTKQRLQPLLLDLLCVLALVVIGTRNHDTDTGVGGVLYVGAPFWIAVALAHGAPLTQKSGPKALPNKWVVVGYTVVMGMVLRHFVFDRAAVRGCGDPVPRRHHAGLARPRRTSRHSVMTARRGAVS